jgi:glycine/D-amino acid oxidase-like deaminating enzyme
VTVILKMTVTYKIGVSMKIAIIGAGFGGMAAAYDLRKAGTMSSSSNPLIMLADWLRGSRNRIGTGRLRSFITTGSSRIVP